MALTRITKGVIKPNENYDTHNIHSTGIVTATRFDGPFTNLNVSGVTTFTGDANFGGNVSIAGTLTYEDVTNIDSVGIITAQKDIHVGAGVSAVGVGTFGSLDIGGDIDVDGHTNLDHVSIAGLTTHSEDVVFKTTNTATGGEAFWDYSDGSLRFNDKSKIKFGNGYDFQIYHHNNENIIGSLSGAHPIKIQTKVTGSTEDGIVIIPDGAVQLYHDNAIKLTTSTKGITVGTGVTIETNGQANFAGITTISGGDLVVKPSAFPGVTSRIKLGYAEQLQFTVSSANQVVMRSTGAYLQIASNTFNISRADMNLHMATFKAGREIELTHNYVNRLVTSGVGVTVYNQLDTTNLSIAGVSTFSGNIDANGNLDVDGTAELDHTNITGIATFMDAINVADVIRHGGDVDTRIRFPANDTITFETSGNERLRIDSSGRITAKETGTGHGMGGIIASTANAGGNAGYGFMTNSANRFAVTTIGSSGSEALRVYDDNNNAERFRIDSSGRVSINDNSRPASDSNEGAQLRVTGAPLTRNQYYSPAGHYYGSFGYTDNTYTKSWIAVDSSYAQSNAVSAGIFLSAFHQDANSSACGFTIKNLKAGNPLVISSVVTASSVSNPAVETERLRITSDGKIGVGNFSSLTARANLHIHQPDSNGSFLRFTNSTSGTGASDGAEIGLDSDEGLSIFNYENDYIRFGTNSIERLRIENVNNARARFNFGSGNSDFTNPDIGGSTSGVSINKNTLGQIYASTDNADNTAANDYQTVCLNVSRRNTSGDGPHIALDRGGWIKASIAGLQGSNTATSGPGIFAVYTHNYNSGANVRTERLRISGSNGNVGISDDQPSSIPSKLWVYEASNDPYIRVQRGATNNVTMGGFEIASSNGNGNNVLARMIARGAGNSATTGSMIFQVRDQGTNREVMRMTGGAVGAIQGNRMLVNGNQVCVFGSPAGTSGTQARDGNITTYNTVYEHSNSSYRTTDNGMFGGTFVVSGNANYWYPVWFQQPTNCPPQELWINKYVHNYATWDGSLNFRATLCGSGYGAYQVQQRVHYYASSSKEFIGKIIYTGHNNAYLVCWMRGGGRSYGWGTTGGNGITVNVGDDGNSHNLGPGNTSETYITNNLSIPQGYEQAMTTSGQHQQSDGF